MKYLTNQNKMLFLFIILVLGLISCSVLGGCREGFDTKDDKTDKTKTTSTTGTTSSANGTSSSTTGTQDITQSSFYGPNGGTAKVTKVNGAYQIQITDTTGSTTNYIYTPPTSSNDSIHGVTFKGAYGGSATVAKGSNGQHLITVTYPSGEKIVYTVNGTAVYNPNAPKQPPANQVDPTLNQGGTYPSYSTVANYYSNGGSAGYATGPGGSSVGYVKGPRGNTAVASSTPYNSAFPTGVSKNNIPPGEEDLYILKSEVVPPVCPACPSSSACPSSKEKCPPCPSCARCPEPSFECKKVPNYSASTSSSYMPVPVLNSFSTFGM